jgi:colanic acid biosynthesis glycosyl transferase WcaI
MTADAGVLVPPGDPRALADAVVALLGDEQRRRILGANARLVAQEHYSWDQIARRLVALYEQALAREPVAVAA